MKPTHVTIQTIFQPEFLAAQSAGVRKPLNVSLHVSPNIATTGSACCVITC